MITVTRACRRAARLPWRVLLLNKAQEWGVKLSGGRIGGQGLIGAEPEAVEAGFASLTEEEFRSYNLPQVWVERRQIPRAIDGRVPRHNAVVLDIGCGPGTSTETLAWFADPSWRIVGYELTARMAAEAKRRAEGAGFWNRSGQRVHPEFVCQDVSRALRAPGGGLLGDGSVDFAVSGGVVGLYMNPRSVTRLSRELARVLRAGGYAALDCGPAVGAGALKEIMGRAGFAYEAACRSFVIEPRPKLVFRREGEGSGAAVAAA